MVSPLIEHLRTDEVERFRARITEHDGHWVWRGGQYFYSDGAQFNATRLAWALTHGTALRGDQSRLMRTCAEPRCIAPAHRRERDCRIRFQDFLEAVQAAAADRDLAIGEVLRLADISAATFDDWFTVTGRRPWRETVERLTAVLGRPDLVNLIDVRARRVVMRCRRCRGEKQYLPSTLRKLAKRGMPGAKVDWEQGTGQYLCGSCAHRRRGAALASLTITRARNQRRFRGMSRGEIFRQLGSELAAGHTLEDREARLADMVKENRGSSRTERQRRRMSRAQLVAKATSITGSFGTCDSCTRLTYRTRTQAPTRWHSRCPRRPANSARSAGRPKLSSDELMVSFILSVRHLLGGEDIGRHTPKGFHQGNLASEFHLAPQTIRVRISNFIELLPEDAVASKRLKVWSNALREAWAELHPED